MCVLTKKEEGEKSEYGVCINILLIKLSSMWLEIEDTRNEDTRETLNQRTYASSEFKRKEIVIHVLHTWV